jgi:hypothetical protein
MTPFEDFHEVWWIFSHNPEFGGLRLAHFRKTNDGTLIVVITGELDSARVGLRIWNDIKVREGWAKIKRIPVPSAAEVTNAMEQAAINGELS